MFDSDCFAEIIAGVSSEIIEQWIIWEFGVRERCDIAFVVAGGGGHYVDLLRFLQGRFPGFCASSGGFGRLGECVSDVLPGFAVSKFLSVNDGFV